MPSRDKGTGAQLEEFLHRLLVLQGGVPQAHEPAVLLPLHHLPGLEGEVQQVLSQSSRQGAAQQGQQGLGLLLGHEGQRLVKLGHALPISLT